MKTIKYQGKKVRVKLLAELDGYQSVRLSREVTGHDQLYCTEAGVYYLEREEWTRGFNVPADGSKEQKSEARYYHSVRQISLTAATLWLALTFVDGNEMQYDIAQAMMDGKGYWLPPGQTQEEADEAGSPTSGKAQKGHGESLLDDTATMLAAHRRLKQEASAEEASFMIAAGPSAMTLTKETMAKVSKFARVTNSDVRDVVEMAIYRHMEVATEDDDSTGDVRLSEAWASFLVDVQDERDRRCSTLDRGQTEASAMKWNSTEELADGGMVICLHLKPEPARLMRAVCLLDEKSPIELLYESLASNVNSAFSDGREAEAAREAIFDNNAPEEEEPSSGMAVRLDKEATELVQRYLKATPRDYTVGDIVSGAVVEMMEEALENLPEAIEWGCLDGDRFHDGAWGYLDDKIMRVQFRREDRDPGKIDEMNWFRSPADEAKETAQPGHDRHPQPDFSLNAAAPEPVKAPEPPPKTKAKRAKGGKEQA